MTAYKKYNAIESIKDFLTAKGLDGFAVALDSLIAERDAMKERLEIPGRGNKGVDGIYCRDETIRLLEKERNAMKVDLVKIYRHLNSGGHDNESVNQAYYIASKHK